MTGALVANVRLLTGLLICHYLLLYLDLAASSTTSRLPFRTSFLLSFLDWLWLKVGVWERTWNRVACFKTCIWSDEYVADCMLWFKGPWFDTLLINIGSLTNLQILDLSNSRIIDLLKHNWAANGAHEWASWHNWTTTWPARAQPQENIMLASNIKLTLLVLKPNNSQSLEHSSDQCPLHWKLKRLVQDVGDFKVPALVELSTGTRCGRI